MKSAFFLAALCCLAPVCRAQSYWQQHIATKIDVTLDDNQHILRGHEVMEYTNNAPDTLKFIYIHLYPNAYSHDHTAFAEQQYQNRKTDFYYAKETERGFIDSLQFSIDGNDVEYFYGESTPDIARIDLPRPLPPGGSVTIATPFRVKLPKVFSRLGHTKQAYFISQWFPKPAVYDKKGWHPMPYLDIGEFYSEIGSYDVRITVPENYIVMATGNLQTEKEIIWLDSLASAPLRKDSLRKITTVKTVNGQKKKIIQSTDFPESSPRMKTLHFREDNIHDFAWFADKRWIVRKDTVSNPDAGALVTTWSAFLPAYEKQWKKSNEHLKNAIKFYGKWIGPYPYKTIKAVQGDMKAGGGMEYPTITVIDINAGDENVIIHEAGHNWFYGILANNERDHAWMDEGLNSFYEMKTVDLLQKIRKDTARAATRGGRININMNSIIHQLTATGDAQPIAQTSGRFKEINYGMDVYYKTAGMLKWLEAYIGEENFEAGIKEYYNTWKHKHPYPEDFQAIMQKHSDKPVDWFFETALTTDRMVDFSLKKARTRQDGVAVTVKNKSRMELPAIVSAYHNDSLLISASTTPFTGQTELFLPFATEWTKIKISEEVFDGRSPNNEYRRHGLFHRSGLKLRTGVGMNNSNKQTVFVLTAMGYNMYDGMGAGLLFHNLTWPETRFKFALAPMYSFRSKDFTGAGSVSYSFYPQRIFKEVFFQIDGKSFHFNETSVNISRSLFARYYKIAPSLNFIFREAVFTSPVKRMLTIKGYLIGEEKFNFNLDVRDSLYKPVLGAADQNVYGLIRYTHANNRVFNPFSYSIEAHGGAQFAKINAEGNLKINYHVKDKGLHLRVFGGKYFGFGDNASGRYYLNSTFTGVNDYLYDDTYLGRSEREGFGIRQISMREGGLKIPTPLYAAPLGRSDNWLAALNIKTDLPLKKLPVRLFADVATFADAGKLTPSGSKVLFNAGIEIYLLDIVNIYIPVVMSKDYNDYRKSISGRTGVLDNISFSINLQQINWLKAPSGIFRLAGY